FPPGSQPPAPVGLRTAPLAVGKRAPAVDEAPPPRGRACCATCHFQPSLASVPQTSAWRSTCCVAPPPLRPPLLPPTLVATSAARPRRQTRPRQGMDIDPT